jgi:hypothetical protein
MTARLSLTSHPRSSSVAEPPCSAGSLFDCVERFKGVDGVFASGSTTSSKLIVVHKSRIVENEKAVDGDTEGVDDAIDDVEAGVGGSAFDFRDRLPAEAGGIGECGL